MCWTLEAKSTEFNSQPSQHVLNMSMTPSVITPYNLDEMGYQLFWGANLWWIKFSLMSTLSYHLNTSKIGTKHRIHEPS